MKKLSRPAFLLIFLLVGNLLFDSCSKDSNNSGEQPNVAVPLIATVTNYDNDGVIDETDSYQYDSQRRLIKIIYDDKTTYDDDSYSLFEYAASTITIKEYTKSNSLDYTSILTLNSKGLSVSGASDNEDYSYVYDSNGYLTSSVESYGTTTYTITYTISGGNCISEEEVSSTTKSALIGKKLPLKKSFYLRNGMRNLLIKNTLKSASASNTTTSQYQFYLDKTNTIGFENFGISYLGKQNKNPIKEEHTIYSGGDYTTTYTYEYDSQERIAKQTDSDGYYSVYTYNE